VRRVEAKPVFPRVDNLLLRDPAGRPDGEIGEVDERRHDRTKRLRLRSRLEPLVQGSTFVRLEMAETQPPDRCGIDDSRDGFPNVRKVALHAGVKEQRLVILDEELIELKLVVVVVVRNAVDVGCDLGDVRHDSLLRKAVVSRPARETYRADIRVGNPFPAVVYVK